MKAVVHIGAQKTGSTTIQSFLDKNREILKRQGIFIPPYQRLLQTWQQHIELFAVAADVHSSHTFSKHLLTFLTSAFGKKIDFNDQDNLWETIRNVIEANCIEGDRVFFSSEALIVLTEHEIEKLQKLMASIFDDITIVLYLRRQPEFHVSRFSTDVRLGSRPCFLDYLSLSGADSFLAYRKIVERWSIFGKNKLKIRIFDKQEFYDQDLLSDFAYSVGFDITGLERVKNENESIDGACAEFLRLINFHVPIHLDSGEQNPDYLPMSDCFVVLSEKNQKAYYLTRGEAQQILDECREGNNWIAREYLGREKLFSEDISMYPEEVTSPHGLTLDKCVEITAALWKERCQRIHHLEQKIQNQALEIQNQALEIQNQASEIQNQASEIQNQASEIQRQRSKRLLYRFKALLAWIKGRFKKNDNGN
jgi:hypothetical protein